MTRGSKRLPNLSKGQPRRFPKSARNTLYLRQAGKCALCGNKLQVGFHADHILPYAAGGTTTLGNGQALCARCNLKKGKNVMITTTIHRPRAFQKRADQAFEVLLNEIEIAKTNNVMLATKDKTFFGYITTGAGKTECYENALTLAMNRNLIDCVVILSPRLNLAKKIDDDWKSYQSTHPHAPRGDICYTSNKAPLLKYIAQFGISTTYQAIVADAALHLAFANKHRLRFMLVVDECQYLGLDDAGNGTACARIVKELAERAAVIWAATATPYRADDVPIFLAQHDANGRVRANVQAPYQEGIAEGYLRPFEADLRDADITFRNVMTDQESEVAVSEATSKIRTIVSDEQFFGPLVDQTIIKTRDLQQVWPNYRALIGAYSQSHARTIKTYIERNHSTVKVLIAVSDDDDAAQSLEAFRNGGYDILITVSMAFIGYNCPEISVVCALNDFRKPSWLLQFFGRGVRVAFAAGAPKPEDQVLFIIAPNDPAMHAIIDEMRTESDRGLAARNQNQSTSPTTATGRTSAPIIVNIEQVIWTDTEVIASDPDDDLSSSQNAMIERLFSEHNIPTNVRKSTIASMVRAITEEGGQVSSSGISSSRAQLPTAAERYRRFQQEINTLAHHCDSLLAGPGGPNFKYTHSVYKRILGRTPATEQELIDKLDWLRNVWYPRAARRAKTHA